MKWLEETIQNLPYRYMSCKFASSMSFSLLFLCMWAFIKEKWRRKTNFGFLHICVCSKIWIVVPGYFIKHKPYFWRVIIRLKCDITQKSLLYLSIYQFLFAFFKKQKFSFLIWPKFEHWNNIIIKKIKFPCHILQMKKINNIHNIA